MAKFIILQWATALLNCYTSRSPEGVVCHQFLNLLTDVGLIGYMAHASDSFIITGRTRLTVFLNDEIKTRQQHPAGKKDKFPFMCRFSLTADAVSYLRQLPYTRLNL